MIEFQRTLISIVMEMTEELNVIEDFVYDNAPRDERRRLAPVRRTVVRLHRHLRTVLALMRRAAASDDDEMPFGFEDIAGRLTSRLETVDHDIYALQDRARLLHEEIDSKLSSETNRHLYILSIMTAFLLPPTLVTGFFGMNTANLPFAAGSDGTEYAVGLIIASIAAGMVAAEARSTFSERKARHRCRALRLEPGFASVVRRIALLARAVIGLEGIVVGAIGAIARFAPGDMARPERSRRRRSHIGRLRGDSAADDGAGAEGGQRDTSSRYSSGSRDDK